MIEGDEWIFARRTFSGKIDEQVTGHMGPEEVQCKGFNISGIIGGSVLRLYQRVEKRSRDRFPVVRRTCVGECVPFCVLSVSFRIVK